jgi:predicted DNA-binding transcriptional regulator YafY
MMAAQNKLLSAVPAPLRANAAQMRARFHLDAPAWFAEAEQPAHLPAVAGAVWDQRRVRIRYRSWRDLREHEVEPLGLVLKGGAWYLIGRIAGRARTYKVARMLELAVLDESFERPAGFDLEAYWRESTRRLEAELHPGRARVRLSPWGVKMLGLLTSPYVRSETRFEPGTDASGWRVASMPVAPVRQACVELLRLGVEVEVLDPPELRARMAELAAGLNAAYSSSAASDAAIAGSGASPPRFPILDPTSPPRD